MADNDMRFRGIVDSILGFLASIILAILAFFVTVFVVVTGADLANVVADGDFVVLSAAVIVAASIMAGGSWRATTTD